MDLYKRRLLFISKMNNLMQMMVLGAASAAKIPGGILGAWEAPG